jgi:hypothetical protein
MIRQGIRVDLDRESGLQGCNRRSFAYKLWLVTPRLFTGDELLILSWDWTPAPEMSLDAYLCECGKLPQERNPNTMTPALQTLATEVSNEKDLSTAIALLATGIANLQTADVAATAALNADVVANADVLADLAIANTEANPSPAPAITPPPSITPTPSTTPPALSPTPGTDASRGTSG